MVAKKKVERVTITAPNMQTCVVKIKGVPGHPLVQNKFSQKVKAMLQADMEAGSKAKNKKRKKPPRDFEADFLNATHSVNGRYGHPASAFRAAMISACRVCGYTMSKAKLTVKVLGDLVDEESGDALVEIHGTPEMRVDNVRNQTGVVDLRARPMWREWTANVQLKWDADQFDVQDVYNLMARVGEQVGIGEGRPDSKKSCGMGWGLFTVEG